MIVRRVGALLGAVTYPDGLHAGQFHLSSWLLYHWLWNQRSAQFTGYQEGLAALEPPRAAWLAHFPELDPESDQAMATLDQALEAYRKGGRLATWAVEAPYDARVALVQRLPSAEVHGLLREVGVARGQSATERQRRWRQDLDEQLAEDPLHPEALAARAVADKRSGVEELRRSVQARPQDPRGWHRLADQLEDHGEVPKDLAVRAEVEAALRRALALAPAEATLNNELAWFLAKDGRSGEALPLARMAVALAPWNASIIDTLAFVQADLGHCPEALALQDRAVDLSPRNARLNARLRQYLASCGRAGERGR